MRRKNKHALPDDATDKFLGCVCCGVPISHGSFCQECEAHRGKARSHIAQTYEFRFDKPCPFEGVPLEERLRLAVPNA